ncbi:MAG: hypothetical protein ACK4V6_18685, partial [Microthrixaceae bacterium]
VNTIRKDSINGRSRNGTGRPARSSTRQLPRTFGDVLIAVVAGVGRTSRQFSITQCVNRTRVSRHPNGVEQNGLVLSEHEAIKFIHQLGRGTFVDEGLTSVRRIDFEYMTALTEIPQFCSSKFPTLGRSVA